MVLSKTEIQIDSQKLMSILAGQFGESVSELVDWKAESIDGGLEQSHQLFRLAGTAVLSGEGLTLRENNTDRFLHPWSLVLKIVHPAPATNDPQGVHYWRREALAYQSGLLKDYPVD
jgi:hypothetical protein